MSAPVDVLAVLQYHAIGLRDAPWLTRKQAGQVADELARASAAVADLIEAAKLAKREVETVCRVEGHALEYGSAVKLGKASSALHTALARVGGAA